MINAICTSAEAEWQNVLAIETGSPDGSVEFTIGAAVLYQGAALRIVDRDNYVVAYTVPLSAHFGVAVIEAGVPSLLGETLLSGGTETDDRVRVEVEGSVLTIYSNDVQRGDPFDVSGYFADATMFGVACRDTAASTAIWADVRVNGEVQPLYSSVLPREAGYRSIAGPPMRSSLEARYRERTGDFGEAVTMVDDTMTAVVIPG